MRGPNTLASATIEIAPSTKHVWLRENSSLRKYHYVVRGLQISRCTSSGMQPASSDKLRSVARKLKFPRSLLTAQYVDFQNYIAVSHLM